MRSSKTANETCKKCSRTGVCANCFCHGCQEREKVAKNVDVGLICKAFKKRPIASKEMCHSCGKRQNLEKGWLSGKLPV